MARNDGSRPVSYHCSGGADWQLIRPDGVAEIEAIYTMKTTDGTLIYIVNRGGPPEVMAKLAAGLDVSTDQYYFRTSPIFETEEGRYGWLNRTLFIGTGHRTPDAVRIQFYRVQ